MQSPEMRSPAAANGRADRNQRAERLQTKQYNNRPSPATIRARLSEIERRYAWHDEAAGSARRRPSPFQNVRLRELERVFDDRAFYLPDDDSGRDDLEIAGHHIFHFPGGKFEARFRSWARLWAPWANEATLSRLAGRISRRPLKWKADTLATRLGLTYADRTLLKITTIGAIDFGKDQREKRRRDRNRAAKATERLAKGATPRSQSNERSKPWTALKISKATWYRKGKPAPPAKVVRQVRVQQMNELVAVPETVSTSSPRFPRAPDWPAAACGSWIAGQSVSSSGGARQDRFKRLRSRWSLFRPRGPSNQQCDVVVE